MPESAFGLRFASTVHLQSFPLPIAMKEEIGIDEALLVRITEIYDALQQLGER